MLVSLGWQKQHGQAMAEYTVVVVAIVSALLFSARNADCSDNNQHWNCVDKLITVMENSYAGYSSSISDVQVYNSDYAEQTDPNNAGGPSVGSGSGSVPPYEGEGLEGENWLLPRPGGACAVLGAERGQIVPSSDPTSDTSDVVNEDGDKIGEYDPSTNEITYTNGCKETPAREEIVKDCEGNVLEMKAVVETGSAPSKVVGFGYESTAENCKGFFLTGDKQAPLPDGIPAGTHLVTVQGAVNPNTAPMPGAVVDGFYYLNTITFNLDGGPKAADGVVVLFDGETNGRGFWGYGDPEIDEDDRACAIMRFSWPSPAINIGGPNQSDKCDYDDSIPFEDDGTGADKVPDCFSVDDVSDRGIDMWECDGCTQDKDGNDVYGNPDLLGYVNEMDYSGGCPRSLTQPNTYFDIDD